MKEVKFNLDEDILFQIAMMTYDKCNSEIATIYDHLGEEYGYSDLQAAKEYELRYEKDLLEKAVSQLQEIIWDITKYIEENKNKTYAPYGDNEDTDYEVCLDEDNINKILNKLKGSDEE